MLTAQEQEALDDANRARVRGLMQRLHQIRKDAGLCRICGLEPVAPGEHRGPVCREKAQTAKLRRWMRGLCAWCLAPTVRGTGGRMTFHCEQHGRRRRVYGRDYKARHPTAHWIVSVSDAQWRRLTGETCR